MRLRPKGKFMVGRRVDAHKTRGGIELPDSKSPANVTVMLVVDECGPDVTRCKEGDVVIFFKMHHIQLRDGRYWGLVHDDDIVGVVENVDLEVFEVVDEQHGVEALNA